MVKKSFKEYLCMWKLLFDNNEPIQKKNLIVFTVVNLLCLLVIYKISIFNKFWIVLDLIATGIFFIPIILSLFKKDVPGITLLTLFKIMVMVMAVSIGLINGYVMIFDTSVQIPLHAGLLVILKRLVLSIASMLFVMIAVLFFNVFNKDRITNIHLQIYFVILVILSCYLTKLGYRLIASL